MATSETLPSRPSPPVAPPREARPAHVIEPFTGGVVSTVRQGWRNRRLVPLFAAKSLAKMYARTWLGVLWLPLRPGIDVLLKIGVIGSLIGSPAPGVPYLLYAIVGLGVWEAFDKLAYWGTRSMETNRSLLRKGYVARLPMLVGAVGPASAFAAIYVLITAVIVVYYKVTDGTTHLSIGFNMLAVPAGLGLLCLMAATIGLFLAPIALYARDVRFTLGYALGFWLYVTPILYPLDQPDGLLQAVVDVNPLSAPVTLVQHGMFHTPMPGLGTLLACLGTIAILLPLGLMFFGRAEATAAAAA